MQRRAPAPWHKSLVDAFRPAFLAPFVAEIRGDIGHRASNVLEATLTGALPAVHSSCRLSASVPCDDDRQVASSARYAVAIEMQLDELARVELAISGDDAIDRAVERAGDIAALYLDRAVRDAWAEVASDRNALELVIRAGECIVRVGVLADDRDAMSSVVALATALAGSPAARIEDLVAALGGATAAADRLVIDAPAARVDDIAVDLGYETAVDAARDVLRTRLRLARTGPGELVITGLEASRASPRRPKHTIELPLHGWRVWGRDWTDALDHLVEPLAIARPLAVVVDDHAVTVALLGWVTEPTRLAAAVGLIERLGQTQPAGPYR